MLYNCFTQRVSFHRITKDDARGTVLVFRLFRDKNCSVGNKARIYSNKVLIIFGILSRKHERDAP